MCSFFVHADPVFQLCLEITMSSIVADPVLLDGVMHCQVCVVRLFYSFSPGLAEIVTSG